MTIPGNRTLGGVEPPPPAAGPSRHTFQGDPRQVPRMREFIRRRLTARGCPPAVTDDVLVCATELATNAVVHSRSGQPGGHFTVEVAVRAEESVYVAVKDSGGPWTDSAAQADDHDAECGRGLRVVAALSSDMGISGGPAGRTAWFLAHWDGC